MFNFAFGARTIAAGGCCCCAFVYSGASSERSFRRTGGSALSQPEGPARRPFLLSATSASQRLRARLNANSQYTVAQVHQVFLTFANRSSLFLPRSFPAGKQPKDSRRRARLPGAGSGCFSAGRCLCAPGASLRLPDPPSSPPRDCQTPPPPARRINTVDITVTIFI